MHTKMKRIEALQNFIAGSVILFCLSILKFTEYGFEYREIREIPYKTRAFPLNQKQKDVSPNELRFNMSALSDSIRNQVISLHRPTMHDELYVKGRQWKKIRYDKTNIGNEANGGNRIYQVNVDSDINSDVQEIAQVAPSQNRIQNYKKQNDPVLDIVKQSNDLVRPGEGNIKYNNVNIPQSINSRHVDSRIDPNNANIGQNSLINKPSNVNIERSNRNVIHSNVNWEYGNTDTDTHKESESLVETLLPRRRQRKPRNNLAVAHNNDKPLYTPTPLFANESQHSSQKFQALQTLQQLEEEIKRRKAELEQLSRRQGDVQQLPKTNNKELLEQFSNEEEIGKSKAFAVEIDDTKTISKSHHALTKHVRSVPAPVFLKQFNNPCYVEEITDDVTTSKYIRKAIRSCDRIRSYYSSYAKAMMVLSDVPVQLTSQGGIPQPGTYRLRCVPHFYLLGFPKCGTTDLRLRLLSHTYVRDAACKEPQFFDRRRFQKDVSYADFLDLFNFGTQRILSNGVDGKYPMLLGEFSTRTIGNDWYWEQYDGNAGLSEPRYLAAHEIHHINPATKLIVSMRNPTERLYSDYLHFSHKSVQDFHDKVMLSIAWWNTCLRTHALRRCLYGQPKDMPELEPPGQYWENLVTAQIRTGMYYHFIVDWLEVFSKDQFLFIEMTQYTTDEVAFISDVILPFLNLGPMSKTEEKRAEHSPKANSRYTHSSKAKVDMLPETRVALDKFYAPFNDRLADLLQDDRFKWHDQR